MHDERFEEKHVASRCGAVDRAPVLAPPGDLWRSQPPVHVRSGEYGERTVFRSAIVEVDPERDHSLEERCRRMGVCNSLLRRPWAASISSRCAAGSDSLTNA